LVYPNAFRVGFANLGFQRLYQYLNAHPRFRCERFFYPGYERGGRLDLKAPLSEETGRSLSDFPLIAFSIAFESDYPAIPAALMAGGAPPLQAHRSAGDPLVLAGGVAVTLNPEPLAPFLDVVFAGELVDHPDSQADVLFSRLADLISRYADRTRTRDDLLDALAGLPSVYVPSAYAVDFLTDGSVASVKPRPGFSERVTAAKSVTGAGTPPASVLFSPDAEFGDALLVETNRGCGRGCRYCAGGWIHLPVRHNDFERLRDHIDCGLAQGRTIGLVGSDLAGHSDLEEILTYINERGGNFSLSSIRPEGLTPAVMRLMALNGQKTVTLAPEAASTRLKKVIGKEMPSERFRELVHDLVTAGVPNIRLYFMIGLPTETDEDVAALVDFVHDCRDVFVEASRPRKRIGSVSVQVNPFVPKPWTPFQWSAMTDPGVLGRRIETIRSGLRRPNLILRIESPRSALFQAILSKGDRRLGAALLEMARRGASGLAALTKANVDATFYALRERGAEEIFPWEVIDHGVGRHALFRIYSAAMAKARSATDEVS
jgi:radical SAM superfamily enzyme YgiQ (UPF0313 family)